MEVYVEGRRFDPIAGRVVHYGFVAEVVGEQGGKPLLQTIKGRRTLQGNEDMHPMSAQ